MTLHDYKLSRELHAQEWPFYALLMAAIRQADTANMARFQLAFPEVVVELQARHDAPGGRLSHD